MGKIHWVHLIQNHGYGIKRYILNEEAYMPSMGLADARTRMFNPLLRQIYDPWHGETFQKKILPFKETADLVFSTKWVKEELQNRINERLHALQESSGRAYVSKSGVALSPE